LTEVIIACNCDSKSSNENKFIEHVSGGLIQLYMFEPKYSEDEQPRDEDMKEVITTEPAVAQEGASSSHVGNTDWCS